MWKEQARLQANDIHFEPGLNEDIAATAIWGSQQAEMRGEGATSDAQQMEPAE